MLTQLIQPSLEEFKALVPGLKLLLDKLKYRRQAGILLHGFLPNLEVQLIPSPHPHPIR